MLASTDEFSTKFRRADGAGVPSSVCASVGMGVAAIASASRRAGIVRIARRIPFLREDSLVPTVRFMRSVLAGWLAPRSSGWLRF
jgi:hypothetical protein